MSIPKEPRQLMINLMYLVLTALLALNVSAEVMNAFLSIDKSLDTSNTNTVRALDATQKNLDALLKDDSKAKYRPLQPAIQTIRDEVASFSSYVEDLKVKLIDGSGDKNGVHDDGDYVIKYDKRYKLKGLKNKDVPTKMMVNEGVGEELEAKILETRANIVTAYKTVLEENGKTFGLKAEEIPVRIQNFENNLTLGITEDWKESKDKTSWSDYKFRQMPVAAVLPTLTQMITDARNAESAGVNQLAELSGGRVVEFNQFFPVVSAKKGYVLEGDKFEAEISVGTYSDQINPNDVTITINGSAKKPDASGKVKFVETASRLGTRKLSLKAAVRNPLTGETSTGDAEFSYEVGKGSVTVSATKMNVFYIGVPNPIKVSAAGVNSNSVKVSLGGGGGGTIKKAGGTGEYTVTVSKPAKLGNECQVRVEAPGLKGEKALFRVKRIPDPTAKLSGNTGGAIGNGEFKAQGGVSAILDGFDFDAKCVIQGFIVTRQAKRADPVEVNNRGPRWSPQARELVNKAKPGDVFYFDNVKAKCPGDPAGRKINAMVFKIK
ncbi:MAG: GldM family protein [Saprospiraceae bacterium]